MIEQRTGPQSRRDANALGARREFTRAKGGNCRAKDTCPAPRQRMPLLLCRRVSYLQFTLDRLVQIRRKLEGKRVTDWAD
jgi:hypothetical protein